MSNHKLRTSVVVSILACVLSACAYRDINPEAAAADEKAHGVDDALRSVAPGTAKLVFRSRGAGHGANYAISNSPAACRDFKSLGNVAYSGRGVVYPWIANMAERSRSAVFKTQPSIQQEVKPAESIQVRGFGRWDQNTGMFARSGTCGPVVAKFTPKADHAYLIEFVWAENLTCSQVILDATNPEAPVPVQVEAVLGCPAS
jgi:hypothetical protein